MARAVTVLPEPDSPTMPTTSFSAMSNDTPSTAFTTPRSVVNRTRMSRTDSSGLPAGPVAGHPSTAACRSGQPAAAPAPFGAFRCTSRFHHGVEAGVDIRAQANAVGCP